MKITKLSMLALLAAGGLFAVNPVLQAQDAPAGGETKPPAPHISAADRLNKLAEELKLTDDQKTKVGTALTDYNKSRRDLRQDSSLSAEDRKEKNKTLHAELVSKMKEILTPDQFKQWQQMSHPGGHAAPPAGTNAPSADLTK